MRLDSLGKPALVLAKEQELLQAKVRTHSEISPVAKISGVERSSFQTQGQNEETKLGQVFELIQKAQERKKKKPLSAKLALEAIKMYQRQILTEEGESQLGQTLDLEG